MPPRVYGDVTVSSERIAFAFAGQLWEVPRSGGTARRLSTTPDEHSNPVYSPDGTQLAYARASAVWIVPAGGGEARRLTWYPRAAFPRAWSPDGRTILFASARDGDGNQRGLTVPAAGGPETMLPLWPVRFASYSPDGKRLALVGRSIFLGGVDRRNYRGGARDPIRLVDPLTGEGATIGAGDVNMIFPMWVGDRVYFATDTLGSFNLAMYDLATRRVRLLTNWRSYGITSASAGGGAIAFVRDGRIHLYDIATGAIKTPSIEIPADTSARTAKSVAAAPFVQWVNAGPRGERVAIEARGDILVVDPASGESRNLTASPGTAERTPVISPDGRSVAYFSDAGGEYALHVRAVDGSGDVRRIALGDRPTYFHSLTWSPDARRIAFSDQRLVLWVADAAAGTAAPVDSSRWIANRLWQTSWSPDSRWLAYAKADPKGTRAIWLRDVEAGRNWPLSSGGSHDEWPVFDPSGRWLYFASSTNSGNASARDVWSLLSDMYQQPFVSHRLMVSALRSGDVLPMLPFNAGPNPAAKGPSVGAIDPVGAASRIAPIAFPSRTIEQLWMAPNGSLVVQATVWPTATALDNAGSEVLLVDPLAPQRPASLAPGVRGAEVSSDGGTLVVTRGGEWSLSTIGAPAADTRKLDLGKATVAVQPGAEWAQVYHEAFRMMRDYFYDAKHHGADVGELERHFASYLPQLTRRAELNDLLLYAFGEVSISHLQVGGGDVARTGVPPERTGVLGVDYEVANGRFRFARILRSGRYQLENPLTRAPLDQPGISITPGEYLLAVDGVNVTADRPVDFFFVGKAARPTTIRVGPTPDGAGAREMVVVPSPGENGLRRANWAEANRREVERRSGGLLAYVYIDGWDPSGIAELNRVLNGNPGAKGLIIDERWNGGGVTPDAAIDMLSRRPLYDYLYRYGDGYGVPQHLIDGPKVLIAHESNGSAAETFALMFKERKVGTIVGRRTVGGGVGGALFYQRLIDGGRVTIPNRASHNSRLGAWEIENAGVVPDVDVPLTPADAASGRDPQLAKAIEVALAGLKTFRPAVKKRPPMPVHPARETTTP